MMVSQTISQTKKNSSKDQCTVSLLYSIITVSGNPGCTHWCAQFPAWIHMHSMIVDQATPTSPLWSLTCSTLLKPVYQDCLCCRHTHSWKLTPPLACACPANCTSSKLAMCAQWPLVCRVELEISSVNHNLHHPLFQAGSYQTITSRAGNLLA